MKNFFKKIKKFPFTTYGVLFFISYIVWIMQNVNTSNGIGIIWSSLIAFFAPLIYFLIEIRYLILGKTNTFYEILIILMIIMFLLCLDILSNFIRTKLAKELYNKKNKVDISSQGMKKNILLQISKVSKFPFLIYGIFSFLLTLSVSGLVAYDHLIVVLSVFFITYPIMSIVYYLEKLMFPNLLPHLQNLTLESLIIELCIVVFVSIVLDIVLLYLIKPLIIKIKHNANKLK